MTPSAVKFLMDWTSSVEVTPEIREKFLRYYMVMKNDMLADGNDHEITKEEVEDLIEMALEDDEKVEETPDEDDPNEPDDFSGVPDPANNNER